MNKEEFLRKLAASLNGQVPQQVVQENIRYYDQYISQQVSGGLREEEVTADIGDPRLIAKTIIDAEESAEEQGGRRSYGNEQVYREPGTESRSSREESHIHFYDLNKWYWKLLGLAVVLGVLFLVMTVISSIFALVIPLLGPVLMVLVIMWFIQMFRRR